jgi:hypothetical protein
MKSLKKVGIPRKLGKRKTSGVYFKASEYQGLEVRERWVVTMEISHPLGKNYFGGKKSYR